MKKINSISLLALSFVLITSCDSGFDDLNKNKVNSTAVNPDFVLNQAIISSAAPGGTLLYDLGIIQQIISSNSGVITGANFNQVNNDATPVQWQNYYRNVIKYTSDVIAKTKSDPLRVNAYSMARILQSYAFMILTDTYGDIPYTEGGQGYNSANFFPKYELQSSIYPKIIQELTDAVAGFDGTAKIETTDVLYGGSIALWRKFGNSLLLRAGMRLVKVDPAKAQATVVAAAASSAGFILLNSENAAIKLDANYTNGVGGTLNSTEASNYYLAKPFVDALKNNADPRLSAIALRYVNATSAGNQATSPTDSSPANQYGMPMGVDDITAATAATSAGIASRYAFSQLDRNRMGSKLSPFLMVTASQTNFLLAEARFRGWIASSTSLQYFKDGIDRAMDQLGTHYGAASAVTAANSLTYRTSREAIFPGNELREINYEYWVASFLNGTETWANFRRTGFPALLPNPYPSRSVTWITRLPYPVSENNVNNKNYSDAVTTLGGDKLDGKVWWDK